MELCTKVNAIEGPEQRPDGQDDANSLRIAQVVDSKHFMHRNTYNSRPSGW
jgi:hypothetical protein